MNAISVSKSTLFFSFCSMLLAVSPISYSGAEDIGGPAVKTYVPPAPVESESSKSIVRETGGLVKVEGALRVDETLEVGNFFQPVAISTPTASSAGKARIWLLQEASGKYSLKVIFPDGTIARITGN